VVDLVALALAALFAIAPLQGSAVSTPFPAPPSAALALFSRYQSRMLVLKQPPVMVFEYTRTRSGPTRVVTENHRVYRDEAGHERNETTAINGSPLVPPPFITYARTEWPYGVDKFLVDGDAYAVEPKGVDQVNGRRAYTYAVVLKEPAAFAVTDLELDVRSALPLRERFTASSDICDATGTIEFGRSGAYWMPTIVGVSCALAAAPSQAAPASAAPSPAPIRDTIRFTTYSYPTAIPPQVFGIVPSPAPSDASSLGP
jgi:hypothetical protein